MKSCIFALVTFIATIANAGIYAELNGLYGSDTFTTTTNASYSKTYYALDIHANLENKARFYGGFHVDQVNFTEQPNSSTTTTMSSLNMGPMFMWVMDHKKTYSLAAGYNLLANGSLTTTGSNSTTLSGSGLWGSFGVMPEISDNLYIGFRLTYQSFTFNKATTGGATTDVSYARSLIFPTFALAWRY